MKRKTITILSKTYERKTNYNCKEVPFVKMGGLWLKQAGFKIGDTLEVCFEKEQIILKKVDKTEIEKYNLKQRIERQKNIVCELEVQYNNL